MERHEPDANGGVAGKQVTVQLGGGAHPIDRVQRERDAGSPGQNRFTALRSFEIWTCNSATSDCARRHGLHEDLHELRRTRSRERFRGRSRRI